RPPSGQPLRVFDVRLEEIKTVRPQPAQQALEVGDIPRWRKSERVDRFYEYPISRRVDGGQVVASYVDRERQVPSPLVAEHINEHCSRPKKGESGRENKVPPSPLGSQSRTCSNPAVCCAPASRDTL